MNMSDRIKIALSSKFMKKNGSINIMAAANAIGVSRQAVMGWINNDVSEIKDSNLRSIERVTGYSKEWIVMGGTESDIKVSEIPNDYSVTNHPTQNNEREKITKKLISDITSRKLSKKDLLFIEQLIDRLPDSEE